jgi:hypothetical protein
MLDTDSDCDDCEFGSNSGTINNKEFLQLTFDSQIMMVTVRYLLLLRM